MKFKTRTFIFLLVDYLTASLAWLLFYIFRKYQIEPMKFGYSIPVELDRNFLLGVLLIPIFWIIIYAFSGTYHDVFRKSRLREIIRTLNSTVIGVVTLFFLLLLDDEIKSYTSYYFSVFTLFIIHFFLTVIVRFLLVRQQRKWFEQQRIGFNTLIVGNSTRAVEVYKELSNMPSLGYFIRGYVTFSGDSAEGLIGELPLLGKWNDISAVIRNKNIEEVIVAESNVPHKDLNALINLLEGEAVRIKVIPDIYDILSGSVRMTHLFSIPLMELNTAVIPEWQAALKRFIDVVLSGIILILLWPLFLFIAILIKLNSKGPVFYHQQRIGYRGKPFYIYKFRTMFMDAEQGTPRLSSKNDDRRTPVGIWLRKFRMDELPQFWNVLKGEMSLVGPRPERQFFIDQIIIKAPHYKHLLKVRPGITSWGQVKYGYAENVDQMVERLKYDIIYIENMSLALDFRIMFYTLLVVLRGRGK